MKTPQLPEVNWCQLYSKLLEAVDHAGLNVEGAGEGYFVLAPKSANGQEPVAWQMRTDEQHNGFADDQWREISRDEYEARKRVMGGNGPKRLAGTTERGDLRIDDDGWMSELRQLFDAPPAQGIDLGQFRDCVVQARQYYKGHDLGAVENCDRLLGLIDQRNTGTVHDCPNCLSATCPKCHPEPTRFMLDMDGSMVPDEDGEWVRYG